jgi:predicted TIM-barrel fold metal-dependent hydrolase
MQTQWGDVVVRDAHVHFLSHRFFSSLATQKGTPDENVAATLGWEAPVPDAAQFAVRWVSELDRHNVASAAIIASVPGDDTSVSAAVTAFPTRLHGYFMVDPTANGVDERVETAFQHGLQGVCLFPAMHRYSIQDPRALAVIATAARHPGSVIFVHCGVLTVGFRKKLGLPSRFDLKYSNPVDLHAVALEFPSVPFVIPHFGAGFLREALMVADLCPNVYLDTSSSNSWIRYFAPEPSLREVFRRAIEVAGPKRLLFGTDSSHFPRGWVHSVFDEQSRILYELGLHEADAAAILGGNLERILRR